MHNRSRFPGSNTDHVGDAHNVDNFPHDNDNNYTKVTYKKTPSLLDRISQTFAGSLLGLGIFAVSFFILFANEGRAVDTARSLQECMSLVIPVASSKTIYQENNNKLIHITGKLRTDQALVDAYTGVAIHAVKLRREVQMYQWVEHRRTKEIKEGHQTKIETNYMYTREWRSDLISSDLFDNPMRHQNQREFPIKPTTYVAVHAYIGSYYLKESIKSKLETFQSHTPKSEPGTGSKDVKYVDGMYYTGNDRSPMVGDVRISYSYAGLSGAEDYHLGPPLVVSVIAKQSSSQLTKYHTEAGDELEFLHEGDKTAKEMIDDEISANIALTWMLRVGGWFMMFMGLYMMTSFINMLVRWIPIIGTLVSFGLIIFNLIISFTCTLVTIAVAWFFYRPLLSSVLICIGLTPTLFAYLRGQRKVNDNSV